MVKLLSDICLTVIQTKLDRVPNVGTCLPTIYKEMLIERLSWHDMLTQDYMPYISYHLFSKTLRRINFYKCEQVNNDILHLLESSGCRLEVIVLNFCSKITDVGVNSLTRHQDQLVSIKFRNLKGLTDIGLDLIKSPALKSVYLKGCSNVTFQGIGNLAERNPCIQELYLLGINERHGQTSKSKSGQEHTVMRHEQIVKIAYRLGYNLEVLDAQLNQMCDNCLVALATHCPNLKSFNIHGSSRVSGEALTKLSIGCTNLRSLDLSYCSQLCNLPGCESLWTLPTSLNELSLCGVLLNDETIFVECLQRLRNLKSARLCGVLALNDNTLTQILQSIGPALTSLDISGGMMGRLSDDGIKAICDCCTNLEVLALSLLYNITGISLLPMFRDPVRAEKFKKLYLSVRQVQLNEDFLHEVTLSCHNLEKLDLSGLHIVNDNTLFTLAENCPKLTELSIKGCRQVTDMGICMLASCCPLRSLVLAGINNLTDKSIFALANTCHYLDEIYLNGCAHITPAAVRYLTDCSIPRLFVKHVTPNAFPNQLMARNLDTGEFCRADLINLQYAPK